MLLNIFNPFWKLNCCQELFKNGSIWSHSRDVQTTFYAENHLTHTVKRKQAVWTNLAKFRPFVLFELVVIVFGKILNLLRYISCGLGQIFNVVNGQILKSNLDIWSHCAQARKCWFSIMYPHSLLSKMQRSLFKFLL